MKYCGRRFTRTVATAGLVAPAGAFAAFGASAQTAISVPTITLEGDANGAPHPEPSAYAKKFSGRYEHRQASGGIGHNPPQEPPEVFAKALMDVARQGGQG